MHSAGPSIDDAPSAARSLAVEYRAVSFSYPSPASGSTPERGGGPALQNISMDVMAGERLGILGPNGGGKSTLVKLTLGLIRGHSGTIRILGRSPEEARKLGLVGYVPQRIEAELSFPLSVRQVVELGASRDLAPWRPFPPDRRRYVDEVLEMVGAAALADRPIGKLSGGQLQRAMIARALAGRPRILFLDEPTVGIDVEGQQRFAGLLHTLHDRLGLTIVIVSHDIRTIAAGCDRVACLGRTLHFHAAPEGLTPRVLAEVFRHDVTGIFGDVHIDAHAAAACTDPTHAHGPLSVNVTARREGTQ
jgi:zinc transport system ATP-binding protein